MKRKSAKALSIILAAVMLLSCMVTPASAASVSDFTDVSAGSWYYDAVAYAADKGIVNGITPTTFAPSDRMTRGQFVTVLGRQAGISDDYTASTPFTDIKPGNYYYPYVCWVYENGIVNGTTATTFSPDNNIKRQEIAKILYGYMGNGTSSNNSAVLNKFVDSSSVAGWALESMIWAVENGILNGSGNRLNPGATATRAEVVTIFYNLAGRPEPPVDPILEPGELTPEQMEAIMLQWEQDAWGIQDYDEYLDVIRLTPVDVRQQIMDYLIWEKGTGSAPWLWYNPDTYQPKTGRSPVDENGGYYDYDLANEIFDEGNRVRTGLGQWYIEYHPRLQEWADIRSQEVWYLEKVMGVELVSGAGRSHYRPDGSGWMTVGHSLVNENIAWGPSGTTAKQIVDAWVNSGGHYANMITPNNCIGAVSVYVIGGKMYVENIFSSAEITSFNMNESGNKSTSLVNF